MAFSLAALAAGLSIVILGLAAYQLGTAVRKLQEELEAKAAEQEKPVATGRRAMLAGLYPAVNGAAKERAVPGGRLVVAAAGLGLVSLLLGLVPAQPGAPAAPPELALLGARVDSLARSLARDRTEDSNAAAAQATASAKPAARRPMPAAVAARVSPSVAIPAAILPDSAPIRLP